MGRFQNEAILNQYYNEGGYNRPCRIGYMMKMIRTLKPQSVSEWQIWYMSHVHDSKYLRSLSTAFWTSIPKEYEISFREAEVYMADVMFRRTFAGYCREKQALQLLREQLSAQICEAPAEWDCGYFIDFYTYGVDGTLIGIQLKPQSFTSGHYEEHIDITRRMEAFCRKYNAKAYILYYRQGDEYGFFSNQEVVDEIRQQLEAKDKIA